MHGRILTISFVIVTVLSGCSEAATPATPDDSPTALGQSFNATNTGTIRGLVTWDGEIPKATESVVRAIAFNPRLHLNPARYSTPHIPKVNAQSRGVENAIVFLRGIDPRQSRSWNHPQVRVEFHDRQLLVVQGNQRSQVGFVRRGAAVAIVNRDAEFHNLHARGANFFAMPLVEANRDHERTLSQTGLVELSCAAGYYWLHAHLFVAEHPYYARTDADGRFVLDQVPAGTYELVWWLPNWHVVRKEVDPETGITARQVWDAPREQTRTVTIRDGEASELSCSMSAAAFAKQ